MTTEGLTKPPLDMTGERHRNRQRVSGPLAINWLRVFGLTLLAFLIRIVMVRFSWGLDPDGVSYAILGKNLIAGNFKDGLSTYWPPLYPLLVGVSSLAFHDLEFAGRFVSVLAGSLLVIPVYYLCLKLYDRQTALVGGFLVAIHALLINYSTSLMADSTYNVLLASAMVLGLYALSNARGGLFLLTGIAFGACYLVRPEAMGYIGLIILLALAGKIYNERVARKQLFLNCLLLVAGSLLLSVPYILYIHDRTGNWTISEKFNGNVANSDFYWRRITPDGQSTGGDILWGGLRPENLTPVQPSKSLTETPSIKPRGIGRLVRFVSASAKGLPWIDLRLRQIVSPPFFVLAGLGLFKATWSKAKARSHIYLLLFGLATVLGYSLTVLQDRYFLPLLTLVICWSAGGVIALETWLIESLANAHKPTAEFFRKRQLGKMLILAVLLISLLPLIIDFVKHEAYPPRSVAAWIKQHSGPSPIIMASGPWAAFLAGGKHLYLPNEDYEVVLNYAQRKGVKYMVIEEEQIRKTPHMMFLLDQQDTPGLKLVHKYGGTGADRVLVYEVVNPANATAH